MHPHPTYNEPCLILAPYKGPITHYKTTLSDPRLKRYKLGYRYRMTIPELQSYMIGKGYVLTNVIEDKFYYSKVNHNVANY